MNCPQCESVLLVEVFGISNPIRCAACGNVSKPVNQDANEASRHARRSYWLGISSILLLFLTGIPAIWYGVRSLLQMRFVRCESKDKRTAATGVALGVLFGIAGTAIVASSGVFMIMTMMMIDTTKDPQSIEEILASVGTIDFPEDFQPIEAAVVNGQFKGVNWRDGMNAADAQGRARLIFAFPNAPTGNMQIKVSRNDFGLHRNIKVESDSRQVETLSWQFAAQSSDIEKTIETAEKGGFNTIRYQARIESTDEDPGYSLILVVRDPGKYAEQDVQKIFESFQPNNQTTPKGQ